MKPTYRRSLAGNLLMFSDLILGPSFKVKRWFTGFGELSFWWIQICIGSPMRRSSYLEEVCGVLSDLVVNKFHRQLLPQVTMLRTYPNMILAVE